MMTTMMTTSTTVQPSQVFAKALNFVLDHEKQAIESLPYSSTGCFTRVGSANDDYLAYHREHGLPSRSVTNLSSIEELVTYMEQYAEPIHVADLPYAVGL